MRERGGGGGGEHLEPDDTRRKHSARCIEPEKPSKAYHCRCRLSSTKKEYSATHCTTGPVTNQKEHSAMCSNQQHQPCTCRVRPRCAWRPVGVRGCQAPHPETASRKRWEFTSTDMIFPVPAPTPPPLLQTSRRPDDLDALTWLPDRPAGTKRRTRQSAPPPTVPQSAEGCDQARLDDVVGDLGHVDNLLDGQLRVKRPEDENHLRHRSIEILHEGAGVCHVLQEVPLKHHLWPAWLTQTRWPPPGWGGSSSGNSPCASTRTFSSVAVLRRCALWCEYVARVWAIDCCSCRQAARSRRPLRRCAPLEGCRLGFIRKRLRKKEMGTLGIDACCCCFGDDS